MGRLMDDFRMKFKTSELTIYETDKWIWSLRPVQATLGASILSLKRECSTLGELTPEEFTDMANIVPVIEKTLKDLLGYNIMNYLMLMMLDKQVHYHVIPRYGQDIEFAGKKWQDVGWPGIPTLVADDIEIDILNQITCTIRKHLVVN